MENLTCDGCGESVKSENEYFQRQCPTCKARKLAGQKQYITGELPIRAREELFRIRNQYYDAVSVLLHYFPDHGERANNLADSLKEILKINIINNMKKEGTLND